MSEINRYTPNNEAIIYNFAALGMSEIDLSSPLNYGTPSSLGSVRTPRSGIRGTPIRLRPDVRSDKRIRQVNVGSDALEAIPESQESDGTAAHLVIWGTNVSVAHCKEKFKQFILRYIDPEAEDDERTEAINLNEPLYLQKLEEIHTLEEPFLNVNCNHLETFDEGLYRQLICYPQEVIPTFDMTVNEMFYERYPAAVLEHQIQVRPFNVEKTRNMRSLNPEDIDQLITICGMVIRTSNIIPEMREAFFKCIVCSFTTVVEIDRGRITEPTLCTNCNTNHCFTLIHNRSQFTDKQLVKLQESPGTSKSQLLQYVYNLVPRSQYTSGKGSSAVGLTAYVTKDTETRQLVLQTGALVLADNGICSIDEFDKMNDSTRSVLHEVMEQQTLSIAKAGIICQLNARTSILAAANPNESQWNKNKTIIENVQLPHTLLSRFDLIFLILDPQNELFDKRLAKHLVSLYYRTREQEEDEILDMSILRDYIAYAKEHIHPKLGEEASQRLIQAYVDMRKVGSGRGQISAYPRQLESLIRLAEAHAKVRFSQTVTVEDVEEAYRLHREALKQSATDPLSGKIDVGILTTGLSSAARKRRVELAQSVKKLIEAKGKVPTINYQKLFTEVKEGSNLMVTREQFEDALKDLQDDGLIVVMGKASIRICSYKD
ncbi:dna replication licensing factor mcm family member [Holotrichia oblita]|uniref:Dna replication licensing factor mcm family member n=1 Tax=Holotrichia oblita TaxID=644536 RepID=A0ACB9TNK1_HOLOL|nr:dna replication licensing factor mcm family member [Holotrichia oblita]